MASSRNEATAAPCLIVLRRDRSGSGIVGMARAIAQSWRRRKRSRADESRFIAVGATAKAVHESSGAATEVSEDIEHQETKSLLCVPVTQAVDDWDTSSISAGLVASMGRRRKAVVVLDGLVSDKLRAGLLTALRGDAPGHEPPVALWDHQTSDSIDSPPSWGLRQSLLQQLEASPPSAVCEVNARLSRLFPEYLICHQPTFSDSEDDASRTRRTAFVANAATHGDAFHWHVDLDPRTLPPSAARAAWRARWGDEPNGAAGKPLFVSLIVYLDAEWRPEWAGETLFAEHDRGVGLAVQPRPGRAVLMHQDVLHRVNAPSPLARRPRYSLVWKLVFVPRDARSSPRAAESVLRPEWGTPVHIE